MEICIHVCIHTLFFSFSLTIKKPSNMNEFTWVFVHLGAVLLKISICLSVFFSLSLFSLCTFLIPPHVFCVCVCVSGWFTLAFSCSSLFGGDCAQAVDWGLSLAFVCSVRHLSPPPRALLCAPLTGSVWGLTGTSVPRLHISLSCLFWTTPSLSTSED